MRKSRIAFAAVSACAWATAAWGQQAPTGVQGFYGAWAGTYSNAFPNGNIQQTFSGSTPYSATTSGSGGTAVGSVAISATPANGNVGLHGFASGSLDNGEPTAGGQFDLYAYDTFQIGGPTGAPEQFQYTLTLNGSTEASTDGNPLATSAYGALQLFSDSTWTQPGTVSSFVTCSYSFDANGNPCGLLGSVYLDEGTPSGGTLTGTLTLIAGSTIQLGELLWGRAFVQQATSGSATFDASNTGFLTLTPITPGASFTTASGLSYAQSPEVVGAVPEPSTWALMLLGFGAIGAVTRRRNRQLRAT